jgi:hypothetical protein
VFFSINKGIKRSATSPHQHSHADGHATLTSRTISGTDERVDRLVNVCIGHDNHVIFGATQSLHAFAVPSTVFVQAVGNGG